MVQARASSCVSRLESVPLEVLEAGEAEDQSSEIVQANAAADALLSEADAMQFGVKTGMRDALVRVKNRQDWTRRAALVVRGQGSGANVGRRLGVLEVQVCSTAATAFGDCSVRCSLRAARTAACTTRVDCFLVTLGLLTSARTQWQWSAHRADGRSSGLGSRTFDRGVVRAFPILRPDQLWDYALRLGRL